MLVYEFKLKGKPHQYQAIDEAIRIVQFIRNKAVRYWMDNRGSGKNDLYKLAASLPKEFEFSDKLNSTARQQATERAWSAISKFFENYNRQVPVPPVLNRQGFRN
jgi:putative transposase